MDMKRKLYVTKHIFDNELVIIHKITITLMFNKPSYVEVCILEISKVLMYKFHCDCVKNKYGNNSRLLCKDTDSLMYVIKTEDVY